MNKYYTTKATKFGLNRYLYLENNGKYEIICFHIGKELNKNSMKILDKLVDKFLKSEYKNVNFKILEKESFHKKLRLHNPNGKFTYREVNLKSDYESKKINFHNGKGDCGECCNNCGHCRYDLETYFNS